MNRKQITLLIVPLVILSCERPAPEGAKLAAERKILASDGSMADVQAKHDQAADGDTVTIPAGTFTWDNAVIIKKGITVEGAGKDQTNIVCAVNTRKFDVQTVAGKRYRISGIKFTAQPGITGNRSPVYVTGFSKEVRVDHCYFQVDPAWQVTFENWVNGVIDHCDFYANNTEIFISHNKWGNKESGDGSYEAPLSPGSWDMVYVEDCYFNVNRAVIDGEPGTRYCFRYNKGVGTIQNHGNEGAGTARGGRWQEVYKNEFTKGPNSFIGTRGGSGVAWGNKGSGGYVQILSLTFYNSFMNKFGLICDGTRPIDDNYEGGPFFTGTHTGPNGSSNLIDSTKNWQVDEVRGFSERNLTKQKAATILHNTSNTITAATHDLAGNFLLWDTGDEYNMYRVRAPLDQPGLGQDTVPISRSTPIQNPKQKIEAYYVWGNTIDGKPNDRCGTTIPQIQAGVHFYSGEPMPGYTPAPYPHYLVSGQPAPSPTSTSSGTPSATPSPTQTAAPTPTATPPSTVTPTGTPSPAPPTATPTEIPVMSPTSTPEISPSPTGSPQPGEIRLATQGYKVKGEHTVDLKWSPTQLHTLDVYRNGRIVAVVPDNGNYTDSTGGKGKATYIYKVCESGTTTCSNLSRVDY